MEIIFSVVVAIFVIYFATLDIRLKLRLMRVLKLFEAYLNSQVYDDYNSEEY